MRSNRRKRLLSALLCGMLLLQLGGCAAGTGQTAPAEQPKLVNLMAGVSPAAPAAEADLTQEQALALTDFALRFFRTGAGEEDPLVSPLSVLCALAMTVNGAEGETLAQMEQTLGLSRDELNACLGAYLRLLPDTEACHLRAANSVWFAARNGFTVDPAFLQINADTYGADAFQAPFDDETLRQINAWVNEKTEGMIPSILDRIPEEAVMYLINALAFEAEWEKVYSADKVVPGIFTREDGQTREVEFLNSEEHSYLENDLATGFIKYYKGRDCAFVALLPKEGVSLSACIEGLDAEGLRSLLAAPEETSVQVAIPKFETEYAAELSSVLSAMGMPRAFDPDNAQLGGLGRVESGNLYISRVLHRTFLSLSEQGTRAGAATAVEISNKAAHLQEKRVRLDRPFVYLLIDCKTNVPFFIGALTDPAAN